MDDMDYLELGQLDCENNSADVSQLFNQTDPGYLEFRYNYITALLLLAGFGFVLNSGIIIWLIKTMAFRRSPISYIVSFYRRTNVISLSLIYVPAVPVIFGKPFCVSILSVWRWNLEYHNRMERGRFPMPICEVLSDV